MGNNKFSIASVGNRRAFRDGARDGVPIASGILRYLFHWESWRGMSG